MVRQVFVWEKEGNLAREHLGLGFGDHPDIPNSEDDRVVQRAVAQEGNDGGAKIRIVLDELVRGNDIEEVRCEDGTYDRVPVGTDPDDIALCSGSDLSRCEAVCLDHMGILDLNGDGAVDDVDFRTDPLNPDTGFRMIDYGGGELAASIWCDGELIPLKSERLDRSFYNPSGNQFIPYDPESLEPNLEGIGPALILFPALGLPTDKTCTVRFRPEVVDKDGNRVCAPPDGDIRQDCPAEGDTELIQFRVEPLAFRVTEPSEGEVVTPIGPFLQVEFVAEIDSKSLGAITLSTGGEEVEIQRNLDTARTKVTLVPAGNLLPETEYVISVSTELTDILGGVLPEPLTVTFSTSAGPATPDAGPEPDAGTPDAG